MRPDPVSPIWRERKAMRQDQDLRHSRHRTVYSAARIAAEYLFSIIVRARRAIAFARSGCAMVAGMASASFVGCSGGSSSPVTACSTRSRLPGMSEAMTGTRAAMASIRQRGTPSSNEGRTKRSKVLMMAIASAWYPVISTRRDDVRQVLQCRRAGCPP